MQTMSMETPATPTIKIPGLESFVEDIPKQLVQLLLARGFAVDSSETVMKVFRLFFEVTGRTIARRSRAVRWSRELEAKPLTDTQRNALLCIQAESLAGEELNPRYSRQQWDPSFSDGLLNDWGIHHFHLGAPGEGPMGLAGGTKELLYAFVRSDDLYFIDLLTHDDFAEYDLIEIVHKNWPELISRYRAPFVQAAKRPSPADLKKARKCLTPVISLSDGIVYMAVGGGISTAGTSVEAYDMARALVKRIKLAHANCEAHARQMAEMIRKETGMDLNELHLVLRMKSMREFGAIEQQSGVEFV